MSDLESRTRFEPAEVEARITRRWLESGLFSPEPEGTPEENYSIAIPPPNVTGALHMGHALNSTIQDTLIRLARMEGKRTKWILGTDHAGIATQKQVEQLLAAEGTSRQELGREAFVQRVWRWREEYGSRIVEQLKRLGASCDFEDERFTLDPGYVEAVLKVFVALYDKGLIYRDNRMVNWDPGLRSAISDLEVEDREVTDTLYSVAYPLEGGGEIVVATVRPETMLADTAVAVNPGDERYRDLIGRTAILPIVGRRLPVIADEYVKTDFGTGALKITPGHDPNDFEIGRKHGLEEITVIGEDGRMTAAAGERFAGLTVEECQRAVVEALEADGAIRAREDYPHVVPFSHRSGARVEPLISLQWFMRMEPLAEPAIAAVREGRVRFVPERWERVYEQWMSEIRPWCISRQLWWGHQIPVWYRDDEVYCGLEPPRGEGWERDPDVLDTWFSSALWPFATLGWPQDTPALRAFYPTNVLSTARDIIFLWVARMIMMGLAFREEVPFEQVYIHSVIQAPDGRRMSKSLGTGIDPLEVIEAHGADATRFGLLAMSSTQDVRYSAEKVEQGQRLANKLFNASRFALTNIARRREKHGDVGAGVGPDVTPAPVARSVEDRWILSRLQRAKRSTREAIEAFEFHRAALGLYEFVFDELCDRYIELVKPRLDDEDVQATLLYVLTETLAMAHPIIPFVTEEIWSLLPAGVARADLLAAAPYPAADDALLDPQAEAAVERQFEAVQAVRGWRQAVGVPPGPRLPARLDAVGYDDIAAGIALLARLELSGDGGEAMATIPVPGGAVAVLRSEAVDLEAHARRLVEQRATLESEIQRAEGKLANERFVAKAPAPVVQAERDKLERLRRELAEL
ncbi:MAG: valine--tRNA ligase [Solirubrobacteraceae bacterium]